MPTVTIIKPTIETEADRKIRAAAYCRVSSGSDDQINSYMTQMTYYTHKFENSETETLVDLYADKGISGTCEDKRPEFQRLIKDCRKGKIDRIYTKSISRFARNTRDCLKNVRELKSLGISIFFEKENIDTANIADEMMITIMGGLAQEESTSISANMKWSYLKQMQDGTISCHSAPYGYRLRNCKLEVHCDEAKIVKKIYALFLSGLGYMAICKELNKENQPKNDKGVLWGVPAIQYILTNERYIGDSLWQKSYNTSLPFRKVRNNGEKDKYYLSDTHEPIITRDDFEKVQKLIAERKHSNNCENQVYPLSKKVYCNNCGSSFKRIVRNSTGYWVCRNHYISTENCDIKRISESAIYDAFIRLHNTLMINRNNILIPLKNSLQELKIKRFSGNIDVMEIYKETAGSREQIHVLSSLRTKGFINETKYHEQIAVLNAKINRLQQKLKKITIMDDDDTLEQIEILVDYFEKRENIMIEFDYNVFEQLVDKIIVINRNLLEFRMFGGLKFKEKI